MPLAQYKLSIVIPVMNEEKNISLLQMSIKDAIKSFSYEIIYVDDGSIDETVQQILSLNDINTKLIVFSKNYGQTSAMAAGIDQAIGEYIVTMDGDLQNDPADIPLMLKKLEKEKLDIVMGKRANRKDGILLRKIPSKVANLIIRKLTKIDIADSGCTLKIFKSKIAKKLDLYGELHRLIPVLASMHGAKIAEMDVKHHSRIHGVSKYGINRTLKVISDLTTLIFYAKYRQKPMHLFGGIGVVSGLSGGVICFYLLIIKILGYDIGNRPLFFIGILLIAMSVQFITTGFIAELLIRTYYSVKDRKPYTIAATYIGGKVLNTNDKTNT